MNALLESLDRLARPVSIAILLTCLVIFATALFPRATGSIARQSGGLGTLDMEPGFDADLAIERIDALGSSARRTYLWTELTLDTFFPLLHGLLFALLILWLGRLAAPGRPGVRYLALVPLAGTVADWIENLGIAALLVAHPTAPRAFAVVASAGSHLKWPLVIAAIAIAAVLAVVVIARRAFGRPGDRPV